MVLLLSTQSPSILPGMVETLLNQLAGGPSKGDVVCWREEHFRAVSLESLSRGQPGAPALCEVPMVPLCLCAQPPWGSNEDIRTFKQEPLVTEPVASGVTRGFGIWCLDKLPWDSAVLPLSALRGPTVWHWTLSSRTHHSQSPGAIHPSPSLPPTLLPKQEPHLLHRAL